MLKHCGVPDLLSNMPVALAVFRVRCDDGGRPVDVEYAYVNEAGARLEGFSPADLVGKSLDEVFSGVERPLRDALIATAVEGAPRRFTCCLPGRRYLSVETYQPQQGLCACVLHDVSELVEHELARKAECARLEQQATRDPLTGLNNVRAARELVEGLLAAPRWGEGRCALFMFDLDDFKRVNDEHGHDRGDAVLKGFARILERAFRCSDIVFRAGGDEFSAFAPDIPCSCVVERICADVIRCVEAASACMEVSVSIGAAVGSPTHSYEEFYRAADQALYGIKRTGKSSYRIADMDDIRARDVQGPAAAEGADGAGSATTPPGA